MSRLTVGSIEGLTENSNVISVPTGHKLNVTDAAGLQIGGSAVVSAGLVHISRTTIGSAVSSVTVSNAFSADYDNYKVVLRVLSTSGGIYFEPTLGSATTGYSRLNFGGSYTDFNVGVTKYGTANTTNFNDFITMNTGGMGGWLEIQSPFLTETTHVQGIFAHNSGCGVAMGYLNDTTSHSSITFNTTSGTVTGGTIDVYGYAKA